MGPPPFGPLCPSLLLLILLGLLGQTIAARPERCQQAEEWPLNGRQLVRDYRGRVLVVAFVGLTVRRDGGERAEVVEQCARELDKLEALPDQFPDVRVLAIAPRDESANTIRALGWQFPRIRFEQESRESPVWEWFRARHMDQFIFDRCSRLVASVSSSASSSAALSALHSALSSRPCGHCEFDFPNPLQQPPPPPKEKESVGPPATVGALSLMGGDEGKQRQWRRWESPASGSQQRPKAKDGGQRLHWTVEGEKSRRVEQQKREREKGREAEEEQRGRRNDGTIVLRHLQRQQFPAHPPPAQPPQKQYLYGQQMGERERMLRERERQLRERERVWAEEQQRRRAQEKQRQQSQQTQSPQQKPQQQYQQDIRHSQDTYGRDNRNGLTRQRTEEVAGTKEQQRNQAQREQQRQVARTTATTAAAADPAPLYPEGSEDAGGEDYYGDEYAAEWTTEAPEAAMQIPRPTKPAVPTTPTTQPDKTFGFELPCTGFTDESCFQQQTQLRPNEVHRCCRGRILFTDQCVAGKCSNSTVQLCCIQRFLQAKLSCCSDERQANTDVGDHFSRCCFENFVDGEDPCCPRAYAAEQWRSVHELCLPNVELNLSGVKVPAPLLGTSLITEFDFSKTDKWHFECHYGGHVQQYSYFEESASEEQGKGGETAEEDDE